MPSCDNCGNEYDHAFEVVMNGERHQFDTFQCAIHALAPSCPACGCKVIGHGVDHDGHTYCCAHCAGSQ